MTTDNGKVLHFRGSGDEPVGVVELLQETIKVIEESPEELRPDGAILVLIYENAEDAGTYGVSAAAAGKATKLDRDVAFYLSFAHQAAMLGILTGGFEED